MKTIKIFSMLTVCMVFAASSFAQHKTETFKVSGNCGMCKKKIEKAAKESGASYALWDVGTKILTVKYNSASVNTAKMQEKIAAVGYDNAGAKATDEAYNNLHGCCKYDREDISKQAGCTEECKAECEAKGCCKKGESCTKACCTSANGGSCAKADCCKKEDDKNRANCNKTCCKKSQE
jgi:periplasmic mercuric ion binding protein